jgi:hypothetical protein
VVQDSGGWKNWNEAFRTAYDPGSGNGWYLSGFVGPNTVYVRFKDNAGNISLADLEANNYYAGVAGTILENKQVYKTNLGPLAWKSPAGSCRAPECAFGTEPQWPNWWSLVSPQDNPSVDFSSYPAQNACKLVGGRLPTTTEFDSMYANKASYGMTPIKVYWTTVAANDTNAAWKRTSDGNLGTDLMTALKDVRCIRDNSSIPASITDSISYDTTAPTAPATVSDGASTDETYTNSATQLSANWTGSTDALSGLQKYQYAIGTTVGGTNTVDWTDNGTNTNVTKTGLTLANGQTYYFSVRAVDNAGNIGTATNSNGIYVDAELPSGTLAINNGDQATNSLNVNLTFTLTDAYSGLQKYRICNYGSCSDFANITGNSYTAPAPVPITIGNSSQGSKVLSIELFDQTGNSVTNITDTIFYDFTAPSAINPVTARNGSNLSETLTENGASGGWYRYNNPNFLVRAVDAESGIKEFKYCFIKGSETCDYTANTPFPASQVDTSTTYEGNITLSLAENRQGILTFKVKGVDYVGLESAEATYTYKFDSSAPASAVYGLTASTTVDGAVQLSWEAITIAPSQAPVEKFVIERIKNTVYVANGLAPNSAWSTGNQVTDAANGYALFETNNLTSFTDNEANTPGGMPVLQGGVKYLYRIKYKDTSNPAYSPLPATANLLALGFTRDRDIPTSPTNVHVYACDGVTNCSSDQMDGTRTHKGHEIKITWNPASDGDGSGIGGYLIYRKHGNSLEPDGWELAGELLMPNTLEWYDNDYRIHQDGTIYHKTTEEKTSLLNDYTYYNYRVVAFDNATTEYKEDGTPDRNDSGLFPTGGGQDMFTNLNQEAVRTPDVSAPAMPTGIVERRAGLDSSREHQQINLYWDPNFTLTDNDPDGAPAFKIYGYKGTANIASPYPSQDLFTDWTSQFAHPSNDTNPNSYYAQGLDDMTYYYFFIEVSDRWGNVARSATITPAAKTGNSMAPGPVLSANVDTFHNFSQADLGDKAYLTFNGAYAKGCQPDGTDCVIQYEIYLSETNDETSCPGMDADACWLSKNTTQKFTIDQPDNNYNDQRGTQFNHTFSGLNDATDYYVRIRAKSNSEEEDIRYGPLYDPTLLFITPDVTAPIIPSGTGLNVKVKDSYPNSTTLRNIITWQLPEVPTRNKLDNSCTTVLDAGSNPVIKNGHEQCNDFAKYLIYRQEVDASGQGIGDPLLIRTETNFNENFYIDSININTDILLLDANLKYYVVIVDNADTAFKYPGTNTLVNKPANGPAIANTSEKSWSLNDIIPNHTTPRLASAVTIPAGTLGVSTAIIEWNTDQPTDSLVEYREAGVPDNTPWIAVGSRENVYHHSVRIFDLKTDTSYDYRVVSRNYLANDMVVTKDNYDQKLTEGNLAISAFPTLRTAKFKIEVPADANQFMIKTTSTVQINWTTTKDAKTNYIEYEATHDPNNPQLRGIGGQLATSDGYNLTSHTVVLKGLRPKTNYRFKIKSVSTDNYQAELPEGNGNYYFFETTSYDTSQFTISPSSSNVAERNITSTTAQIVWSTANATTSHVDFGTAPGVYPESAGDDSLNTQHAVVVNGLVPGTKYYYKVRGTDDYGNTYTSQEFTFTAILKPKISNLTISDITPYSAILKWETNVETETIVNWGKSTAYGEKRGKNELTKNHVLVIDNLEDNTEYHYQIVAHDQSGNEVVDEDKVVRTPLDTVGPKISDLKIDVMPINENDTTGQVIISWKTDKPATSLVQYDEGIIGGRYSKSSTEDTTLSNTHTVIIKGLDAGKNYHFRILAKDKRGNETISNDYNFITPTQEKSILQLILKSLEETFSWVSRLGSFFTNLGKKAK